MSSILASYSECATNGELIEDKEYQDFLKLHSYQLQSSGIPSHFWKIVYTKLSNQIYDAGKYFQMCIIQDNEDGDQNINPLTWQVVVTNSEGIVASNSNNIFVVDHAWTYQTVQEAKTSLESCPGLLERMCNLMDIKADDVDRQELIKKVLRTMWKYNGTYSIGGLRSNSDENLPMWYIMDEFGSRIQHDGDPNFRMVPLYFHPHKCCYSLLFPIKDVEVGEEVTRNYVESPPVDDSTRDAQMLPWFPEDLSHLELKHEEPPLSFFTTYRHSESMPESTFEATPLTRDRKIKVFSDYEYVREFLTDTTFEITNEQEEADIIWLSTHFKDFGQLAQTPHKRVNQFPCESLITVKDLLAIVSRRCDTERASSNDDCYPVWSIPTFCLKRELAFFASVFQKREKLKQNNVWIVKPWNLARGMDHTITDDLNHIVRLPATGPKIAQKYLENPVLFFREDINAKVKFDLRFIVLLLNVNPLKVAIYKHFWIRFANKNFGLEDFEDDQKHFTVNNYNDSFLLQMYCDDFIAKLESQYPSHPWSEVQTKINKMVKELFEAATKFEEPRGIPNNPQSKGSYGLDVMIDWAEDERGNKYMQPKLLEVNFNSDCKRACEYYPNFFNDLFNVMFLDGHCDTIQVL